MSKVFGAELAKQILQRKERLIESMNERDKRINDGWTDYDDCFMSIRTESQSIHECDMQLEILKGDGLMDVEAIFDENGDEVNVHAFENKWRRTSYVGRGIFASSINALLKKTGWVKKTIRVPVWTKFYGAAVAVCVQFIRVVTHTFVGIRIWLRANMWVIPIRRHTF